jgi:methylated-DNA-[protein]-cysteine S-methyltransferase
MKKLAYDSLRTSHGRLYIAMRAGKLAAIQSGGSAAAFTAGLRKMGLGEPVRDAAAVRGAARQVADYFAGKRRAFRLEPDWSLVTPFQARVLRAAMRIPYGEVRTYGDLACAIRKPGAARAVGQALGMNPFAPVVPCHRVVSAGGRLGGFSGQGGVSAKLRLLRMEASL